MSLKKIMVCLDGSKNSLRGLDTAILFAKQSDAMILGVHSDKSFFIPDNVLLFAMIIRSNL